MATKQTEMSHDKATQQNEKRVIRKITEEDKRVYDSLDEAKENRPEGRENWSLFQIGDKHGKQWFVWSMHYHTALWWVVVDHLQEYSVNAMEDLPSKADVASYLASLSEKDRGEVLAQYKKGK